MSNADLSIANDTHDELTELGKQEIFGYTIEEAARTDADEIEWRFKLSTERLRDLREQKRLLFDAIRDEVIANNRLARAAKIYDIQLEGDQGGD